MAGTMSRDDLVVSLRESLHDAASVFEGDPDIGRLLDIAAQDFNRHRPRTLVGTTTVVAGQSIYSTPSDLYLFKSPLWGVHVMSRFHPWEKNWPGPLPRVQQIRIGDANQLHMSPAPTQLQINVLGSEYRYYYLGRHQVAANAAETTLDAGDRFLLLLRAQAEAMRELMIRNIHKPVQMRDSLHSAPRNMTPSAAYKLLLEEWEAKVERLA